MKKFFSIALENYRIIQNIPDILAYPTFTVGIVAGLHRKVPGFPNT